MHKTSFTHFLHPVWGLKYLCASLSIRFRSSYYKLLIPLHQVQNGSGGIRETAEEDKEMHSGYCPPAMTRFCRAE